MKYKTKLILLSAAAAALALAYILSFVFYPGRQGGRAFAWLPPELLRLVDRVEIYSPAGSAVLSRKNNVWFFTAGEELPREFPAKQGRAADFLAALSRRDVYALRAVSDEGRERLGLAEGRASRIIVRGGAGLPLLDLLAGSGDALGREIYLRRAGTDEIYSGEDRLTYFIDSGPAAWYDLRLFGGEAGRRGIPAEAGPVSGQTIDAALVQQAEIRFTGKSADGGETAAVHGPPETLTFRRSGTDWIAAENESAVPDGSRVEAWLRSTLEAEGEDFGAEAPACIEGSITLHLGDGSVRTIRVGPADEQKRRSASVSGTEFVYVLGEWTLNRLFRERSWFFE